MGFIYQIKNDINDKTYVGKTTRTIAQRFQEHLERIYQRDNHLYLAMRKYGKEHFYIIQLEECANELLNEREKYWISQMDSYNNGYNETLGGDGSSLIDYELQIKPFFNTNLSTKEISNIIGISSTTVCNCFNLYFTKEEIKERANKLIGNKNSTIIEQYDFDGNFIQEYPSLKSVPNICHRNISDVLNKRRKSAGGFLWKRKDDPTSIKELVLINKNKYRHQLLGA